MMNAAAGIFLAARRKPRLPYDAEVEYLESTGTQYIDTGCNADGDLFWTITARATQSTTQRMGAIQASSTVLRNHLSIPESANCLTNIGYNQSVFVSEHIADFGTHVIQTEQSGGLVLAKIDGTQFDSISKTQFDIGANFFLFARNGKTAIFYGKMMLYAAQLFRGSAKIRDFVPVRFTNELGQSEGAMMDTITRRIYRNAGTGAFLYGADKTA